MIVNFWFNWLYECLTEEFLLILNDAQILEASSVNHIGTHPRRRMNVALGIKYFKYLCSPQALCQCSDQSCCSLRNLCTCTKGRPPHVGPKMSSSCRCLRLMIRIDLLFQEIQIYLRCSIVLIAAPVMVKGFLFQTFSFVLYLFQRTWCFQLRQLCLWSRYGRFSMNKLIMKQSVRLSLWLGMTLGNTDHRGSWVFLPEIFICALVWQMVIVLLPEFLLGLICMNWLCSQLHRRFHQPHLSQESSQRCCQRWLSRCQHMGREHASREKKLTMVIFLLLCR